MDNQAELNELAAEQSTALWQTEKARREHLERFLKTTEESLGELDTVEFHGLRPAIDRVRKNIQFVLGGGA